MKRHSLTAYIPEPEPYDILCGKDKTYGKHPGNKVFRSKIESSVEAYKQAPSKQEKMRFTRQIVGSLRAEFNARFVRRITVDGQYVWEEISDQVARDKVSHALRFAAKHKSKGGKKTQSHSTVAKATQGLFASISKTFLPAKRRSSRAAVTNRKPILDDDEDYSDSSSSEEDTTQLYERQQSILGNLRVKPVTVTRDLAATNAMIADYVVRNSCNSAAAAEAVRKAQQVEDPNTSIENDQFLESLRNFNMPGPAMKPEMSMSLNPDDWALISEPILDNDWDRIQSGIHRV